MTIQLRIDIRFFGHLCIRIFVRLWTLLAAVQFVAKNILKWLYRHNAAHGRSSLFLLMGVKGPRVFSCVEIQMYCVFQDMCLIRRGFFVFHFSRLLSDFLVKPSMSEHSTTSTATQSVHTLIACSSFGLNPVHILSPLCQEPSIESVFEVASEL